MDTVHRKYLGFMYEISRNHELLTTINSEFRSECIKLTLLLYILLILRISITIVYVRASALCAELIACVQTDRTDIASSFVDLHTTIHT